MFLTPYFSKTGDAFEFTREQASLFAKKVAGDFNPIHDEDNKRFCVPGDLLFALLVSQQGVSQKMSVSFSGMVSDSVPLSIQHINDNQVALFDEKGKEYLNMEYSGETSTNPDFIEHIITNYVQFSGMNFPHIMVPLMVEKDVMFNCQRPLVIYERMDVEFSRLDFDHPEVEFSGATFDVEGKRGVLTLNFAFKEDGEIIGRGVKRMIASGLKPYVAEELNNFVDNFNLCKSNFGK